jgi:hypothetical protein
MISETVKKSKTAFGPDAVVAVKVDGLENPVSVRQLDEEHVEMYIAHTVHMDMKQ